MKMISWNVNGLRACMGKGFLEFVERESPDLLAVQETKMKPEQANVPLSGYHAYFHSAERPGYSGTAVFSKQEPIRVTYGIGDDRFDCEGRCLALEFPTFRFVTVYAPNAQDGLKRIDYRLGWEEALLRRIREWKAEKTLFLCGDLNVAHREIDLKNPAANRGNAGFSDEEREQFQRLLDAGLVDTFRYLYPDRTDAYSWWSYRFRARERNAGWRIDYFLTRTEDASGISDSILYTDVTGSDHCPVGLLWEEA